MALGFRQLRYFVGIAEAGALSHAAQSLNVAQSALSHHVAQLEAELGVKLIERRPRGIALTAAGQRLYEHARSIIAASAKAEQDIRTFSEAPTGAVAIGLAHTAVDHVALALMQAMRGECPDVAVSISEALSAPLVGRVLSGEIDMALVYNTPDDARLDVRPLLEEDMYLVGLPSLIGASKRPVAFAEIPPHPILAPYPSGTLRAIVESHVLRSRIKPSQMLEIDSLTALRQALEGGLGCTILGRSSVTAALSDGSLHARRIVEPGLTRTLELASQAERPRTRAFVETDRILTGIVRAVVRRGDWPARWVGAEEKGA